MGESQTHSDARDSAKAIDRPHTNGPLVDMADPKQMGALNDRGTSVQRAEPAAIVCTNPYGAEKTRATAELRAAVDTVPHAKDLPGVAESSTKNGINIAQICKTPDGATQYRTEQQLKGYISDTNVKGYYQVKNGELTSAMMLYDSRTDMAFGGMKANGFDMMLVNKSKESIYNVELSRALGPTGSVQAHSGFRMDQSGNVPQGDVSPQDHHHTGSGRGGRR